MASTILSDNGVTSGSAGLKSSADSTGVLALQTSTSGGTATTALTIDTSQNVGIGTTSPAATTKLDVVQDQNANTWTRIRNNDTGSSAYAGVVVNANGNSWGMRVGSSAANSNSLQFTQDALGSPVVRLTLDTSGNMGIGTASPVEKLHLAVSNASTVSMRMTNTAASSYIAQNGTVAGQAYSQALELGTVSTNPIMFVTNNIYRGIIDSSGNLGIGTTSPLRKFHVKGSGNTSQFESTSSSGYVYIGDSASSAIDNQGIGTVGNNLSFLAGGSERMRISSAGVVTTPYNPAFVARKDPVTNTSYSEVTGYDSTDFNTGSYFSTSTGRFTAPVAGVYFFFVDMGWTSNSYSCDICKNGSRYMRLESNGTQAYWIGTSVAISLAVNDYVSLYKSSTGNNSMGGGNQGGFGGFLIG
jgi:hypothetical protein